MISVYLTLNTKKTIAWKITPQKTYSSRPPPANSPLVLVRSKQAYETWHKYLSKFNRVDRYTIGVRVDDTFLSLVEFIFRACFGYDKFEKLSLLSQANAKNDILKFFLQIVWEQKLLDHTQYASLILLLDEIGRMLGGWKKSIEEKL